METETIDKLYLELSQFTRAKTRRELTLEKSLNAARNALLHIETELTSGRSPNGVDAAALAKLCKRPMSRQVLLTYKQVDWLHSVMQNPLNPSFDPSLESPDVAEMRKAVFDATEEDPSSDVCAAISILYEAKSSVKHYQERKTVFGSPEWKAMESIGARLQEALKILGEGD